MVNPYDQFDVTDEEQEVQLNPYNQFDQPTNENVPLDVMINNPVMVGQRFVERAPESIGNAVNDLAQMVLHPIETGKGAIELGKSGLNKLGRVFEDFYMGQETEPREGESEVLADMVIQGFKDDYGSMENIANTLMNDPARALTDLAGGAGILPKIGKTLQRANPITAAGRLIQEGVDQSGVANKLYRGAAGIEPSSLGKGKEVAEFGVKERVPVGTGGFQKIKDARKSIGGRIQEIIDSRPDMPIPTRSVTKYLDALIDESKYVDDLESINTFKKLRSDFDLQFGDKKQFFPDELQKWKTNVYDKAYQAEASIDPLVRSGAKQKGQRTMGYGARTELENRFPDLVKPNGEFAEWAALQPYVRKTIDNMADPQMKSIVNQTLTNPAFTSRLAIYLDKFAKGDMGWLEKNLNTHEIRTVMSLAGRNERMIEEETVQ